MQIEEQSAVDRFLRLNGQLISLEPLIVKSVGGEELEIAPQVSLDGHVRTLLSALERGAPRATIHELLATNGCADSEQIIGELEDSGIIRVSAQAKGRSGMSVLLEIEDLSNDLLYKTLYQNVFWRKCQQAQQMGDIPERVIYGMVIENYHFLFRESYFDAPVLSYVPNTDVRLAMNEFFSEEYGHDELLLTALGHIGISREELQLTVPLPQTMNLCNALAYWAHNDPLFFFTTLGILEGKDIEQDSFLNAAQRIGIAAKFLKPVKSHSDINLNGNHGSLTRKIFSRIPVIDVDSIRRMRAQTHTFIELYDAFYSGVWNHYSQASALLRRIDQI
jgi:hypothetical protein